MSKKVLFIFLFVFIGSLFAVANYDLVIVNGTIIDGTGAPRFHANVGIRHGQIKEIGDLGNVSTARIIDAAGLIVAPGFIESHANDRPDSVAANPYALSMIHQGVTSLIMGEQGFAPSPHYGAAGFNTLVEGFDLLMANGIAINYGTYIDQADVRIAVMGFDAGDPSPQQLEQMKTIVEDAMKNGAFGLSSALAYAPGSYNNTETIIELARVAASYGGTYKTHVRGEDQFTLSAGRGISEAVDIGQGANIPVVINHMKAPGVDCYDLRVMRQIVDFINDARASGVEVSAQMYPYQYGVTSLHLFLPPWRQEGGNAAIVASLNDPATREEIRKEIYGEIETTPFFNFVMVTSGGNWEKIKLVSAVVEADSKYLNKDFYEIAQLMGYDIAANPKDAIEAYFDLVISEYSDSSTSEGAGGLQPKVILPAFYSEEDLFLGLRQSWVGIACDGLSQKPEETKIHPRCFGSYPKVLGYYSREKGLFSLEDAVRKMTGLIARQVGISDRGVIAPGYAADITIFNPDTVNDLATYGNPNVYPAGIEYVIVNGRLVIDRGELTGALPGRILRRKSFSDAKKQEISGFSDKNPPELSTN